MADQNMAIWQDRYTALAEAIAQFQRALQHRADTAEEPQEVDNLLNLATCLGQFAKNQFQFFYDGFVIHDEYILNPSREFHPHHVLSVVLAQIAEDLAVLWQVAGQRLAAETGAQLRDADKLAWSALKPAVDAGLIPDSTSTVMTYFLKGGSIRMIPYAPVALVSLPFSGASVHQDCLGLPHEVGHYVYRHARVPEGKSIPQMLGKRLLEVTEPGARWARRWQETIFADVYSCLIGGPVSALSFRDLMLQSSLTPVIQVPGEYLYGEFSQDDGVHPAPVVRPYVYFKTLEEVGLQDLADQLVDDWKERPEVKETTEFRTHYTSLGAGYVSIEEGYEEVGEVVEEVLRLLPQLKLDASFRWSGRSNWESIADLYGNFEANITQLLEQIKVPPINPMPAEAMENLWRNWIKKENFFPGFPDDNQPPRHLEIDSGKADRLEVLEQEPHYTWNHVFLAAGWATRYWGTGGGGVVYPKNSQV
ncbi:MAG: hypothetical protein HYR94_13980, partial [Chloroflexi bacterium]|nr:hypothetical protein [Chloroflexota bacterium]